ncbi:hypothetical protein OCK74_19925 [Chitinophagaceae bacterium LB-8]|uniref:Uncharacterized protein n=1 Tax=Paraflavisolibacter caeni TaxID=2982496 RepID=A0A9X2XYT8_9BACT|nr:hypothetical protein [Paraflavisolibacter caeni]MCU7551401.1 hypothetical protein [Paraflavisolibacter caeni]
MNPKINRQVTKIVAVIASLFFSIVVSAQQERKGRIWWVAPHYTLSSLRAGGSFEFMYEVPKTSARFISFHYSIHQPFSRNVPPDFERGFIFSDEKLTDQLNTFGFGYGRLQHNKTNSVIITYKAGVELGSLDETSNFVAHTSTGWFNLGPNYNYDQTRKFVGGVFGNAAVLLKIINPIGLKFGMHTAILSKRSYLEAQVGLAFGHL